MWLSTSFVKISASMPRLLVKSILGQDVELIHTRRLMHSECVNVSLKALMHRKKIPCVTASLNGRMRLVVKKRFGCSNRVEKCYISTSP